MRHEIGSRVRAVYGPRNTINPDPKFVGRTGQVEKYYGKVAGMPHYQVRFNDGPLGVDTIDGCNLEKMP